MILFKWDTWWYFSIFAPIAGIALALYIDKIKTILRERIYLSLFILWLVTFITTILLPYMSNHYQYIPQVSFPMRYVAPFTLLLMVVIIGFPKNRVLNYLGGISFEIYLVHYVLVYKLSSVTSNWFLYVIFVFGLTIPLAQSLKTIFKNIGLQKYGRCTSK